MQEVVRLGLMSPLTGLVALYGEEIVRAARIACDEINDGGGVLGRPLELVVEDDGSLPDTAVPAARRLVEVRHCAALIGNLMSNSRIAVAAQVAEPQRIPYLNFSYYEGSILSRYFFHFAALPNQQIDRMLPFVAKHFGPKVFFAGHNYEWPRGSIDAAKGVLRELDGDIVGEEYLALGAGAADIERLLEQLSRSGADVLMPFFAGDAQITLLRRITERGLNRRMAIVMCHADEMLVSRMPPQVRDGLYATSTYFMSLDTPENHRYLELLARQPGVDGIWPHGNGVLTSFGEGAYLCVHAFAAAAAAAASVEAEALVAALETVRVRGPQGEVVMDAATHHASVNTRLARCRRDGTFRLIEEFGRIPPRIPERYHDQLQAAQLSVHPAASSAPAPRARLPASGPGAPSTAQQILAIADLAIIAAAADGVIIEANRCACAMFGYADGDLCGLCVYLLLPPHLRHRHADDWREFLASEPALPAGGELIGYRKDGSFFPMQTSIGKFRAGDQWVLVLSLHDISEHKKAAEDLLQRATHDPLTELANRGLIRERLQAALQRSRRSARKLALLYIDLDGFKLINDTYGHEVGDWLLRAVAGRLIAQVRPGDTVARLAGDEFVILCEQIEQPGAMSELAERLNNCLRKPYPLGELAVFITSCIGIAIGSGSTHGADDLLRFADTAMHAAKEKGRDNWQFFNESLQVRARQRLAITNGLRLAIERAELSPRFQPILAADSGRIVGAELLLRWHPPEGEVPPVEFIPIAETTGSIIPIGAWVFRAACRAEAAWRRRWGERAPYVSVNVSARQLSSRTLVDDFAALLRESAADPTRLLLEITETALMADVETNLRLLRQLAALGLRVAVDDFGTGYSSLAQLTRLPVDVLKIDRAFVAGLDQGRESRAVIRAVIGLGRALGLKLVAEGVESGEQKRELHALGCDFFQGYHFHRPLEEAAFLAAVDGERQPAT